MRAPRARRSRSRCRGPATSRSACSMRLLPVGVEHRDDLRRDLLVRSAGPIDHRDVLHAPHPGQLAARETPLRLLDGLDVAGQQLVEADRRAGCPRGAPGVARSGRPPAPPAGPSRRRERRCARAAGRGRWSARPAWSERAGPRPTCHRRWRGARFPVARARSGVRSACGRWDAPPRRARARARRAGPPPPDRRDRPRPRRGPPRAPADAGRARRGRPACRARSRRRRSGAGPPPAARRSRRARAPRTARPRTPRSPPRSRSAGARGACARRASRRR